MKVEKGAPLAAFADAEKIAALFPSTSNMPDLKFSAGGAGEGKPVNVAVILSGGQALAATTSSPASTTASSR